MSAPDSFCHCGHARSEHENDTGVCEADGECWCQEYDEDEDDEGVG